MTKPIIVVKVPCKLLYVIQVKELKCLTSWPYLISEFLVAYIEPLCIVIHRCITVLSHLYMQGILLAIIHGFAYKGY